MICGLLLLKENKLLGKGELVLLLIIYNYKSVKGGNYYSFYFFSRLLSGVKKLFIFQLNDGKVTVRNDIIVTHLTHVSCF